MIFKVPSNKNHSMIYQKHTKSSYRGGGTQTNPFTFFSAALPQRAGLGPGTAARGKRRNIPGKKGNNTGKNELAPPSTGDGPGGSGAPRSVSPRLSAGLPQRGRGGTDPLRPSERCQHPDRCCCGGQQGQEPRRPEKLRCEREHELCLLRRCLDLLPQGACF